MLFCLCLDGPVYSENVRICNITTTDYGYVRARTCTFMIDCIVVGSRYMLRPESVNTRHLSISILTGLHSGVFYDQ